MKLDTEPGSAPGTPPLDPAAAPPPTDWRASLPESYDVKDATGAVTKLALRGDPTIGKYKSVEELARGHIEATKMIGRALTVPGPDAKPEERHAFYDKLGRPKDAAGYAEVKAPDGVLQDGLGAFVQNVAVPGRWDPRDVQAAVNFLGEFQTSQRRDMVQRWDEGQEDIRKEWGYNFDRNHDIAKRFVAEVQAKAGGGTEQGAHQVAEFFALLDQMGLGHHPGFVRWSHYLAVNATEDTFVPGAVDAAANASALDARITQLQGELAKVSRSDPRYATLLAEYEAALRARHGSEEKGAVAPVAQR